MHVRIIKLNQICSFARYKRNVHAASLHHIHTHTATHAHAYTHTHKDTNTHAHTYTHAHTHTPTNTHTHGHYSIVLLILPAAESLPPDLHASCPAIVSLLLASKVSDMLSIYVEEGIKKTKQSNGYGRK